MKVDTAIICAGGYGTRFLPFTKSISKELLPIGGVPAIQIVVEECIKAGFEKIVIVVPKNTNNIQAHFQRNEQLEEYLKVKNKDRELNILKSIPDYSKLIFVEEQDDLEYGNLAPILSAQEYLSSEYIAIAFSDDLIINGSGIKEIKDLFEESEFDGIIASKRLDRVEMVNFGNIIRNDEQILKKIIQKPKIEEIASDFALISRLIVPTSILKNYHYYNKEPDLGSTISEHCEEKKFYVKELKGEWLNLDTPESYYRANETYYRIKGVIT